MPRSEIGTTRAIGAPLIAMMSSPGWMPARARPTRPGSGPGSNHPGQDQPRAAAEHQRAIFIGEVKRYQVAGDRSGNRQQQGRVPQQLEQGQPWAPEIGMRSGSRMRGREAVVPIPAASFAMDRYAPLLSSPVK